MAMSAPRHKPFRNSAFGTAPYIQLYKSLPSRTVADARGWRECTRARLHGERGRGQAREAANRRAPVRALLALAGRAAARTGAERVPEDTLLGGVRPGGSVARDTALGAAAR